MNNKNPTKKKTIDSDNIDSYRNLNNLNGSTNNNYDVGNTIINEDTKKTYGNNSNLYSKDYVPSKNEIDNMTEYENKKFSHNQSNTPQNSGSLKNDIDVSMDSVLRDSINNSTNKPANSKKWVYNSERKGMY